MIRLTVLFLVVFSLLGPAHAGPGKKKKGKEEAPVVKTWPDALFKGMEYRHIGPFRGGRSAAVGGVPGQPTTFYMGSTGGGVWTTGDGGSNWRNISDGFFGGSIGAVAVSEWDPNVIYVGGGEVTVRGNVSHGYGMFKTTDKGKTWKQIGLEDTRHIPRIRIHPKNPDLVYAAAMGHLYGPNEQRGIFRSKDGGETWDKILYVSDTAGAVDLAMDPNNPRIMFASFWRVLRTPYSLESGGEGSSIWKTSDGGENWEEISGKGGLPEGTMGISGVSVSPVNPERVWAIVESDKGGVYRSDDGGKSWKKTNEDRNLRQRAWYYTRIYADTGDQDTVYVLNVGFWKSKDGGQTFSRIRTPHGDHHDLWIDPQDPKRMIIGDDGGAQVTYDGGNAWSTYMNQPTAQFYRVTTDNKFPYRIYAAQQDNSTIRISHRKQGGALSEADWERTAGGESGFLAPHPDNPEIVYGGSYDGDISRIDHATGERRGVNVWPDNPMGHGAEDWKYRFQWNFPIFFSPHDANVLYAAGNVLFKSTDEGQSWEGISADMTRNDPSKQKSSGGPITQDNTSVEYYCTIFAAAESQHEKGVIWTGSDDGLVFLTRDGGANWAKVTPPGMPEWMLINSIEIDPFNPGGLYLAGTRYKLDDFTPYLYKTEDYGKSWKLIVNGIEKTHFTRVVRADPGHKGLLYAGTESGMYISFDDGANWQTFMLNLPSVPITDLAIKDNDLIVATQGRALWVLDDLTALHQMSEATAKEKFKLFAPRDSWRMGGFGRPNPRAGENLPGGVLVHFYLAEDPSKPPAEEKAEEGEAKGDKKSKKKDKVKKKDKPKGKAKEEKSDAEKKVKPAKAPKITLSFSTEDGTLIREFSTTAKDKSKKLKVKKGFNRFAWNLRYPNAEDFPGMIVWAGRMSGPTVLPGSYKVKLTYGEESQEASVRVKAVPNMAGTTEDLEAQFTFLMEINKKLTETHQAIKKIRKTREQIKVATEPMKGREDCKDVLELAKAINKSMKEVEEALYQTKNKSGQDPLNFPIRLNNKLAALNSGGNSYRPTNGSIAVKEELVEAIDAELAKLAKVFEKKIPELNEAVKAKALDAIWSKDEESEDEESKE